MTAMLDKAGKIWRDEGLIRLVRRSVRFGYDNFVRSGLPKQEVNYNGVRVLAGRLGDSIIPWQETDIPGYEEALLRGIRQHVSEGDTVTIVGGGWGVSTVVAAKCVGKEGNVTTYEGSPMAIENVNKTLELNKADGDITLRHAIVAEGISLRGGFGVGDETNTLPASDLPDCDVLVLDCEGAEVPILSEMEIEPRTIIVETHGIFEASVSKIGSIIDSRGYRVIDKCVAEARVRERCLNNGIYVLIAKYIK